MTRRRAYAKFQPDDRPKKLPPPGHPDWDEYDPPDPKLRNRPLSQAENGVAWVIRSTFEETGARYHPAVRKEAYAWIMHEDDGEPFTFSWCCHMLNLNIEWLIKEWVRTRGPIRLPTRADRVLWAQRKARYNAACRRKYIARKKKVDEWKSTLTRFDSGCRLTGETEGTR